MTRGVLLIAHDNERIAYSDLAAVQTRLVRRHMGVPVTLLADAATAERYRRSVPDGEVIEIPVPEAQQRNYHNGPLTERLSYLNRGRVDAVALSPYEETLLLDVDYFVFDGLLNLCWGSAFDLMMNDTARHVGTGERLDRWVTPMGIRLFWATAIYWRRSRTAEVFFNLMDHIRENYEFYQGLYGFPGRLYRNDFVASAAAHMLGGNVPGAVVPLPVPEILTATDRDRVVTLDPDGLVIQSNTALLRFRHQSVHVMNKLGLAPLLPGLLETLS